MQADCGTRSHLQLQKSFDSSDGELAAGNQPIGSGHLPLQRCAKISSWPPAPSCPESWSDPLHGGRSGTASAQPHPKNIGPRQFQLPHQVNFFLRIQPEKAPRPLSLIDWNNLPALWIAGIFTQRTIQPVVSQLLQDMGRPARGPRDGKNTGE